MAFSGVSYKDDMKRLSSDRYRGTTITEFEESSSTRSSSDSDPPKYEEILIQRQRDLLISGSNTSFNFSKPIAIPATNADLGSAFLRAYPPVLEDLNISRNEFLEFLDHLNRAIVASPGLRVLGYASDVVGFVPEPTAQIVSAAAGISANVGTFAMSKIRSEMVIRQANKDIFFPRGLEAKITKLKYVAKLANMPILNEKGKIDKQSPILEPLQALAESNELKTISAQQRRLRALETWISPLVIEELPPVANPSNLLSKVDVFVSEAERKSAEKSMLKKRVKVNDKHEKASQKALSKYENSMGRFEEKARSVGERDRHADRDFERLEDRRLKATLKYEKEVEKAQKRYKKRDKEEKSIRRINFLVIIPKSKEE
ncbi:uncharacterized protein TrAFT101_011117 [Trichoderma asperellum]|uniref:uncharacterized protein n=1 Tax=Trichoderma asperellum TaxID=101201 RepID=UPI003325DCDF|nr:hypothetical protein TrAFT101_011117 [Trichoderma asperellum]